MPRIIRLSNALKAPLAPGMPQAELNAENANLALHIVDLLESTAPASLAGLQEWVKQRRDNLLNEEERSLDKNEYLQVLRLPETLSTAEQAAYSKAFSGKRYELAEKLLRTYAPEHLLPFMFCHQHAASACEALFPPVQLAVGGSDKQSANGNEAEPEVQGLGNAESLLRLAIWHGELRTLQRTLLAAGPNGRAALLDFCVRLKAGETFPAAEAECTWQIHSDPCKDDAAISTSGAANDGAADRQGTQEGQAARGRLTEEQRCQFLYRCQVAMQLPDEAGLTSLRLAFLSSSYKVASLHLQDAALHFRDALAFLQRTSSRQPVKAASASVRVRLTPSQLTAFSTRVALQLDVHSFFQRRTDLRKPYFTQPASIAELPSPANVHLFSELEGGFKVEASPIETAEAAAEQRRLEVAKTALGVDFDLAFRVIHAFGMAATDVYSAAAHALATSGDQVGVAKLLEDVQGINTDQEFDQVVNAAIAGLMESSAATAGGQGTWVAPWRRVSPVQQLIRQMRSQHSQVLALLQMGLLEEAASVAMAARSKADVQQVLVVAQRNAALDVIAQCGRYLSLN